MIKGAMVLAACLCQASAQEANPILWKFAGPRIQAKAGSLIRVPVEATIEAGWHLYSLKKLEGGPIPTSLTVPAGQPFRTEGKIESPDPIPMDDPNFGMTLELYLGKVRFVLPVRVGTDAAAGPQSLKIAARYQTCSDKICLPPKTVAVEVPVTVTQ